VFDEKLALTMQTLVPMKKPILVCTGGAIIGKYNYDFVLDLIALLKQSIPAVLFYAVGNLEDDPGYVTYLKEKIQKLKLHDNVIFTGFLFSERFVFEIVVKIYLDNLI
jgi:glycosyltransferase involved in cell wall biosynthesis